MVTPWLNVLYFACLHEYKLHYKVCACHFVSTGIQDHVLDPRVVMLRGWSPRERKLAGVGSVQVTDAIFNHEGNPLGRYPAWGEGRPSRMHSIESLREHKPVNTVSWKPIDNEPGKEGTQEKLSLLLEFMLTRGSVEHESLHLSKGRLTKSKRGGESAGIGTDSPGRKEGWVEREPTQPECRQVQ